MPPDLFTELDADLRDMIQQHWRAIRTRESRGNRLQDRYNIRVNADGTEPFPRYLQQIMDDQRTVFKINLSFGFILRNHETQELTYFHPSVNNQRFFETPHLIRNQHDLNQLMETVRNTDFIEFMKQQRPNTKHILDFVTNVTFYVTKLHGHPIGRSSELPAYILNNKAIVALVCDGNSGVAYQDALCFFRCLAVFNGCHRKNLKAATDTYFLR